MEEGRKEKSKVGKKKGRKEKQERGNKRARDYFIKKKEEYISRRSRVVPKTFQFIQERHGL